MTDYSSLQANAKALITAKGQAVTLGHDDPSATDGSNYDPATGTTSGDTPTSIAGKAVKLPLDKSMLKAGSNIVETDELLYLAADIAKPPQGAVVTLANGNKVEIVHIEEINPAGTPVLFICVVRDYQ